MGEGLLAQHCLSPRTTRFLGNMLSHAGDSWRWHRLHSWNPTTPSAHCTAGVIANNQNPRFFILLAFFIVSAGDVSGVESFRPRAGAQRGSLARWVSLALSS